MTFEVKITSSPEIFGPQQQSDHAHNLGALFVDGNGIEIRNLHIGVRSHGMRHRPAVFRKLYCLQKSNVLHSLHGSRTHVG